MLSSLQSDKLVFTFKTSYLIQSSTVVFCSGRRRVKLDHFLLFPDSLLILSVHVSANFGLLGSVLFRSEFSLALAALALIVPSRMKERNVTEDLPKRAFCLDTVVRIIMSKFCTSRRLYLNVSPTKTIIMILLFFDFFFHSKEDILIQHPRHRS